MLPLPLTLALLLILTHHGQRGDQSLALTTCYLLLRLPTYHGQREDESLAGAGEGDPDHVPPREHGGQTWAGLVVRVSGQGQGQVELRVG